MINKTHKASVKLATLWQEAAFSAIKVNNVDVVFTANSFKKLVAADKKSLVPTNFVMVDPALLPSLTAGELQLVIKIMAELKRNNALWYFKYRLVGRAEGVISLLRSRNILYRTDDLAMHIVNPWLIRRGTIPATVVATTSLVDNNVELSPEMVKDLRTPNTARLNGFYSLLTN